MSLVNSGKILVAASLILTTMCKKSPVGAASIKDEEPSGGVADAAGGDVTVDDVPFATLLKKLEDHFAYDEKNPFPEASDDASTTAAASSTTSADGAKTTEP